MNLKALLIHRMDDLNTHSSEAMLNHYSKHMSATGMVCLTVTEHLTAAEYASGDPSTWLRVALRLLCDVDCLVTIDTINPDRHREVLRTAAEACGHAMMVAEKYCPPFTVAPQTEQP